MNKSYLYTGIAIVVAIILAGVGFYYSTRKPGMMPYGNSPGASQMSMKELFAKGASQRCTFDIGESGNQSSGVLYMAGGRMRGDFSTMVAGKKIESHMLTDGQTAHLWGGGMPQGIKMGFSMMGGQDNIPGAQFDGDLQADYNCSNWAPDQSLFNLPVGITFIDFGASQAGAGTGASQCAQCNVITDPTAKAQCRVALSCN